MGFKDKLTTYYTNSYLKKYGDRLSQVYGNALSVKIEEKSFLFIFHKLVVTILVRPQKGMAFDNKTLVKCIYTKKKWFKKPAFIQINQGNLVQIQGLKGKKGKENRETISIMNVRNITTKKDLVPVEGVEPGKVKKMNKTVRK